MGPNQSPPRVERGPWAIPTRSWGNTLALLLGSAQQRSAVSTSGSSSWDTSMAASPIVLTSRTGGSATADRQLLQSAGDPAQLSGRDLSPRRVKPTRSANAHRHVLGARPSCAPRCARSW